MTQISYRKEIDGLRAIAVLAVVAYHAFGIPSAGFVGVDIFFVISGYLITALLLREYQKYGGISITSFYARRARRILPALFIVILATQLASSALLFTADEKWHESLSAIASLIFIGNIFFQNNSGGYFDGDTAEMPLLHLWSLGVEEQFYIIWPLILISILLRRPSSAFYIVAALAGVSLMISETMIRFLDPAMAFYQMPARFWELAAGGLIALHPVRPIKHAPKISTVGLALIVATILIPTEKFPGFGALPSVAGASLLIYAIHNSKSLGLAGSILRSRPMVFFGVISYSLYLWHWPLLAINAATSVETVSWLTQLSLVVLATALAWISYRYIETPFRHRSYSSRSVIRTSILATTFCVSTVIWTAPNTAEITPPTQYSPCYQTTHSEPEKLPPDSCNSIPNQPPSIVLWGDSHALAWRPFAKTLAEASSVSAAEFTFGGCPPAVGFDTAGPACVRFNRLASERIAEGGIDTVILAARLLPYFEQLPDIYQGKMTPLNNQEHSVRASKFKKGIALTISSISPYVRQIIIMGPLPQLTGPAPRCLDNVIACAMPRVEFDALIEKPNVFLQQLARDNNKIIIIDSTPSFCDANLCPPAIDKVTLYRDAHHISAAAAKIATNRWRSKQTDNADTLINKE